VGSNGSNPGILRHPLVFTHDPEIDMKELLVAIDLEMNQPSARIIQIGAVLGNVRTGKVLARFDVKVNPLETLDPRIIELTGITQIEVDTACTLAPAYKRLAAWLAPHAPQRPLNPLTWGGGDSDTLREQLGLQDERWLFGRRWIDVKTLYVAWRMARGKDIQGGLAKAMTQLGLAFSGRKHNATHDAENTFRMYCALLAQFQAPLKQGTPSAAA
jgi:inhibitor of KinA sporulation pathway (predicted exonuclease)